MSSYPPLGGRVHVHGSGRAATAAAAAAAAAIQAYRLRHVGLCPCGKCGSGKRTQGRPGAALPLRLEARWRLERALRGGIVVAPTTRLWPPLLVLMFSSQRRWALPLLLLRPLPLLLLLLLLLRPPEICSR